MAMLMLRCSDEQPTLSWKDRIKETRKADTSNARDWKRDRERQRKKALVAKDFKLEP